MKLTKARLRQIIKEEISALQNEPRPSVTEAYPDDAEAGLDSTGHGFIKRDDPRLQLLDNAVEYFSDNIYQPPTDIDVEEFRYYYNIYQKLRSVLTSIRGRRFASRLDRGIRSQLRAIQTAYDKQLLDLDVNDEI
tara:strand:- start:270 stop:674 length:405 start_codon:yes stop_codon:yes gene_type:complete